MLCYTDTKKLQLFKTSNMDEMVTTYLVLKSVRGHAYYCDIHSISNTEENFGYYILWTSKRIEDEFENVQII